VAVYQGQEGYLLGTVKTLIPERIMNQLNNKYHIIFGSLILILFAACYHTTMSWMYGRFMSADSYYSHGFIIPLVSAFFIWQKRAELKNEPAQFCGWGLLIIIFSVCLHLAGTIIYVFSVSGFSIFFLIIGTTLFIFGKNITRKIIFPLMFLILMFPLPSAIIGIVSTPMKMIVAKSSVLVIRLLGISVLQEGFHISIPAGALLVGNPCSGLRSLIAFFALGSLLAHISGMSNIKKGLLIFSVIPIALIANMIRVVILVLISHFWGLAAAAPESFWHNASGVAVFFIGLAALFSVGRLME
jgi:exosortase